MKTCRTIASLRRALLACARAQTRRFCADHGLPARGAPQPGAALPARKRPDRGLHLRQSLPVRPRRGPAALPARPATAMPPCCESEKVDVLFMPGRRGNVPASPTAPVSMSTDWTTSSAAARGPATSAAWPPSCSSSSTWCGPQRAYFGQKDAQQAIVIRQMVRDLHLRVQLQRAAHRARCRRPGPLLAQRLPFGRRSGGRPWPCRAPCSAPPPWSAAARPRAGPCATPCGRNRAARPLLAGRIYRHRPPAGPRGNRGHHSGQHADRRCHARRQDPAYRQSASRRPVMLIPYLIAKIHRATVTGCRYPLRRQHRHRRRDHGKSRPARVSESRRLQRQQRGALVHLCAALAARFAGHRGQRRRRPPGPARRHDHHRRLRPARREGIEFAERRHRQHGPGNEIEKITHTKL